MVKEIEKENAPLQRSLGTHCPRNGGLQSGTHRSRLLGHSRRRIPRQWTGRNDDGEHSDLLGRTDCAGLEGRTQETSELEDRSRCAPRSGNNVPSSEVLRQTPKTSLTIVHYHAQDRFITQESGIR